jgi:hypothetical protein
MSATTSTITTDQQPPREWLRVKEAANRIGLKGARMLELLKESRGQIKCCELISPGSSRGAKLINIDSLHVYLERLAQQQNQQEEDERE